MEDWREATGGNGTHMHAACVYKSDNWPSETGYTYSAARESSDFGRKNANMSKSYCLASQNQAS